MKTYKHIGIKVPDDFHYKLKYISLKSRNSITDLLMPLIDKLIKEYEEKEGVITDEKNS